jgi:hypothetical protein
MAYEHRGFAQDEALDALEGSVLPTLSIMLEALLDAARLGEEGAPAHVQAAELRTIAMEIDALTRRIEAMAAAQREAQERPTPLA